MQMFYFANSKPNPPPLVPPPFTGEGKRTSRLAPFPHNWGKGRDRGEKIEKTADFTQTHHHS